MNKILIVGHPQSGYPEVESLLHACGMNAALPSRREGFLPAQISATLCKVHKTSPNVSAPFDNTIQQIDAGPIWQGMALDLMLGNLDQDIWGWADPQSIYLLDYWKNLDPNITFILVYDTPHSVLTRADGEESANLTTETLNQRTQSWYVYNAALLHFFHRNSHRCLLVSSQQVRQSASSYLQQVRARIDAPWSEDMERLLAPETGLTHVLDLPPVRVAAGHASDENAVMFYLADALIKQQTTSLQLYEELQSVANLPLSDGAMSCYAPMDAWLSMTAQQQCLSQTEKELANAAKEYTDQIQLTAAANAQLIATKTQADKRATELSQQAEKLQAELQAAQAVQPVLTQENELLLAQLHQVQEELVRHYLQIQQQEKQLTQSREELAKAAQEHIAQAKLVAERQAALEAASKVKEEQSKQLLALTSQAQEATKKIAGTEAEKAQLAAERDAQAKLVAAANAQLSATKTQADKRATELSQQADKLKAQLQTTLEAASKAKEEQSEQLLILTGQVQEATQKIAGTEAEKAQLAVERDAQAKLVAAANAQLSAAKTHAEKLQVELQAAQAVQPVLTQENELLLTQLHQVQEELERHYLQGQQQEQQLTQSREELAKAAQEHTAQVELAAAANVQLSAAKTQAEKLQAELQAAQAKAVAVPAPAVNTALEQENELLLAQLHQVQEELERYYLENQALKASAQIKATALKASEPVHYGAANRIKAELSYRLGAIMIEQSRSWSGRLGIPAALANEAKRFKREKSQVSAIQMPPISDYRDAHEAERVKQHLSYRLGSALIAHSRSPLGWVKLPFAISRQVKEFKASKQRLQG